MDRQRLIRLARLAATRLHVRLTDPAQRASIFRAQGARIGEGCVIYVTDLGTEPYLVSIGSHCVVATDVLFVTHDGSTRAIGPDGPRNVFAPIAIGEHCFIGARAILLPGTRIGDHTVIGAGAVVRGDVPAGVVVAGAPARVIETIAEFEEKARARSLPVEPGDPASYRRQLLRLLQK